MTEMWRKNFIHEQRGAYQAATIEKIGTHWLIFDTQTDEAIPFSKETFEEIGIQIQSGNQEWISIQYYDTNYLQADEKLIPIQNQMNIRIETALSFAYHQWLEQLPRKTLLTFTQFINDLNYSLFDCVYCHNTSLFQNAGNGHHVNFIFLDNSDMPCSIHHSRKEHMEQFDLTLANGKIYQFTISDI